MYGKKRAGAAAVALAVGLGITGCGSVRAGAEAPSSVAPRPGGTGPLTRDVVKADVEGAAADAGVPANAPEYGEMLDRAPADSARPTCGAVAFKGFATEDVAVDLDRYEKVLGELAERSWLNLGKGRGHEEKDGVVHVAQHTLTQRGWTLVAEHRPAGSGGVITLTAFDTACAKKVGPAVNPLG
ncbi:hypothetical protein [Streptomyces sp. NPDC003327]